MSQEERRSFSREFKLAVIWRLEGGESASALALELGVRRQLFYRWRDAFRAGGELALRTHRGRPVRFEALAMSAARGSAAKAGDLAAARRQITDLQLKVGQQQLDLDFFQKRLAAYRDVAPAGHRCWRDGVFAEIQAMTQPQGTGRDWGSIERLCVLAEVSRAGFYRHWGAHAPLTACRTSTLENANVKA